MFSSIFHAYSFMVRILGREIWGVNFCMKWWLYGAKFKLMKTKKCNPFLILLNKHNADLDLDCYHIFLSWLNGSIGISGLLAACCIGTIFFGSNCVRRVSCVFLLWVCHVWFRQLSICCSIFYVESYLILCIEDGPRQVMSDICILCRIGTLSFLEHYSCYNCMD